MIPKPLYSFINQCNTLWKTLVAIVIVVTSSAFTTNEAEQTLLEKRINISVQNQKLSQVLSLLEKKAHVKFSYIPQQLQADRNVSIEAKDRRFSEVLDEVVNPIAARYEIIDNDQIVIKAAGTRSADSNALRQQGTEQTVTGSVKDQNSKEPIPGVNISIKGSTTGTITDPDGRFELSVPNENTILVFSYVGFISQEITVGTRAVIDVFLASDTRNLEEVVVTAFGIKREKKALTFATGELKGADFADARETNLANALSAKIAGVQVTSSSGGMSGSSRVIIRGNSSLSGNSQPLYVIDGVPMDNSNQRGLGSQTFATGVDGGDGISNINPNDIESVTVLKGPNGAALYGQLGANGVILITTKSGGKNRKTNIQYNGSFSTGRALIEPDYQNVYGQGNNGQFTFYRNADGTVVPYNSSLSGGIPKLAGGRNPTSRGSWGPKMEGQLVEDMWGDTTRYSPIDNPYKHFFQPERMFMNTVSVDGGGEKTSYYFSINNVNNDGFQPTNKLKRNSVTLKLSSDIAKGLNIDAKVNYIRQDVNNRPYLGDDGQNAVYRFLYIPRSVSMEGLSRYEYTAKDIANSRDIGGNGFFVGGEKIFESNSVTSNPFWTINNNHNEDQRDRLIGYVKLNYELAKGLSVQARYGTDFYYERQYGWSAVGTRIQQTGSVFENNVYNKVENLDVIFTGSKEIGDFSMFFNAGGNRQKNRFRMTGNTGTQLSIPGLYAIGRTILNTPSLGVSEYDINSLFAAANFGWRNIYFLDVTARNDWSSTLPVKNSSFFYPSIGGSFVLTDALNISSPILSYAKLRGSWAQAGRSGSPYNTIGYYSLNSNTFNSQPLASYSSVITDPNLKNELKTSYEIGAELRFLKNKLLVDFTYYHSVTSNQILPITISQATGYSTKLTNAGKIRNKGIEMLISATPVSTAGGFKWETSLNIAANRNQVLELIDGVDEILVGSDRNVRITAQPGKPYGVVSGADYGFLKDEQGRKMIDENGLPIVVGVATQELGNANPKWTGGFSNNFSYKGFSLSTLIDMRRGGIIFSQGRVQEAAYGTSKRTLEGREGGLLVEGVKAVKNGNTWTTTGEANTVTTTAQKYWNRVASDKGFAVAEEFIYDASYIAVREIRLAYQLPSKLFTGSKIFQGASIALYGRNLGYIERHTDGFSPENSSVNVNAGTMGMEGHSLPMMRNFGVDINVKF